MQVRAAWTVTQPAFIMPYTDPAQEWGVSHSMEAGRAIEPEHLLYWEKLSNSCCARGGLTIDVGANFGFYSLFSAALGCRSLAWEPVPAFRAFLHIGATLNNVTDRIRVRSAIASDPASTAATAGKNGSMRLAVPRKGLWGTASLVTDWAKGGTNVDDQFGTAATIDVEAVETVDGVMREEGLLHGAAPRACIMKIDVEGTSRACSPARRSCCARPPHAILKEYTPGIAERHHKWSLLPQYPASLAALHAAGYRTTSAGWGSMRTRTADAPARVLPAQAHTARVRVARMPCPRSAR